MIKINNKKGLSAVVAALMLVLLTLVLVGIVWAAVKGLVDNELPEADCLDAFGKVTLESAYTCYNSSTNEMQFSINVEDISIDKVLVSFAGNGMSKSIDITNQDATVAYTRYYNGGASVKLPGQNSGLTYIYNSTEAGFTGKLDSITIIPYIGDDSCEVSDTIDEIYTC